ncbi:ABC transporter ATP-binding protein/permease [Actinoplanes aureus]|uniref:ATP-binding cassette domain-containing protein n=1 Tax=Actinoplanes aureus TaxID=2792083 RepID=A0A931CI80_9ACTN|nr:ATP-binding cassette domain-containing protein [Actinoplanes aureus]MBG0566643.1 ATP-binding cassette domain-containing protein [Actinoplanes aureus]
MNRPARTVLGALLLTVPLLLAVLGPVFAGSPNVRGAPFTTDGLLGTDFVGRDVVHQVLLGGRSIVLVAVTATLLAYLVGVPVGMLASTSRRRWLDELLMRPLDLVLAVPSLLLFILLAATAPPGPATLIGVVALIAAPEIARITRAAALPLAHGPAMEAMRLHRETWSRRAIGYVGYGIRRVLLADAGVRFIGAVYLVATASFLGIGVAPDAADWAVMVDRNRTGLFLQPWSVVVPAVLIIALAVGFNLVTDRMLTRKPVSTAPPAPARPQSASTGAVAQVANVSATAGDRAVLTGVNLEVAAGQLLAIVGRSGSGKSTLGRTLLGETTPGITWSGDISVAGHIVSEGTPAPPGTVGYVPQQPSAALNPVRRIGAVLKELTRRHSAGSDRRARRQAVTEVLTRVSLPSDRAFLRRFPHQLSGGQQQRLVIAHALLCRAVLLIADEPTTGQDAITRNDVADELGRLAHDGIAVVLLSHDLELVRSIADDVLVLQDGNTIEHGPATEVLATPRHQHTQALTTTPPAPARTAATGGPPLLRIAGLSAAHRDNDRTRTVLHHLDLTVPAGQSLAVVGRSGSGKTTLARCIAGLHTAHGGTVTLDDQPLHPRLDRRHRHQLAAVQYVFQDARASFNPYRPVLDQILRAAQRLTDASPDAARRAALDLIERVGLTEGIASHRPDRLSGGELHRAALARALITGPRLLICDEITAGLDGITQHRVLDLLDDLRRGLDVAVIVISHDRDVVTRAADHIVVLDDGHIVEQGPAADLLNRPRHSQTRALLHTEPASAAPHP